MAVRFQLVIDCTDPERLARFRAFVNSEEPDPTIARVEIRGQRVPA